MARAELPPGARRKLIEFDAETWRALHTLGARSHEHDTGARGRGFRRPAEEAPSPSHSEGGFVGKRRPTVASSAS